MIEHAVDVTFYIVTLIPKLIPSRLSLKPPWVRLWTVLVSLLWSVCTYTAVVRVCALCVLFAL